MKLSQTAADRAVDGRGLRRLSTVDSSTARCCPHFLPLFGERSGRKRGSGMPEFRQQSYPVRPQGRHVALSSAFHTPAGRTQVFFPASVIRIPRAEYIDVSFIGKRPKHAFAGLQEFCIKLSRIHEMNFQPIWALGDPAPLAEDTPRTPSCHRETLQRAHPQK
jgi:hypothetical protein